MPDSAFHPGEQALQERLGVRPAVERAGHRIIRPFMPDQHRELFAELPMILVGSLDAEHRPWASVLAGRPGFLSSPDPVTLAIHATPPADDPLAANLRVGAPVGLLGIQLETRRRNRMNGTVAAVDSGGAITVHVDQSFGNCPKYIQARAPFFAADPATAAPRGVHREGRALSPRAAAMVTAADTFFIATAAPGAGRPGAPVSEGVDVSHRGGRPGFVRVSDEDGATVLTSPDFIGNFLFNTLGNLAVDPRAGILVIDFATGDLLSLTGAATVVWDGPELAAFEGAERLLRFVVAEGVLLDAALPLRWSAATPAPQLAETGSWQEVAAALGADAR
jgi:predicted pyridoxine 5'-phosphate oxidase superfamily flavin-nucleotide-binding protein